MATQLSIRFPDDLEADLEAFRNQHELPPDKSQIVRAALREYLDSRLEE